MNRLRWAVPVFAAGIAVAVAVGVASATWSAGTRSGGSGAAAAATLNAGQTPTAISAGTSVTVSWGASTLSDGDPAAAYLVRRYDATTLTLQTVLAGCAGRVAATGCTESDVPTGRWVYSVTPLVGTNWVGSESPVSDAVWTDPTAPTNAVSAGATAGAVFQAGDTVYYRGAVAGSLVLSNVVTDTGSGPASSSTGDLGGATDGWTHVASTVSTPSGGPYVSTAFSWSAGTVGTATDVVTSRDAAGNSTATTITFVDDSSAPTGDSISYPDGYQPAESVNVTFTAGTDAGSGVSGSQLQRASADFADGTCGSFSPFADIGSADPASPFVDDQVTDASCYVYRYLVSDNVTNQDTATSANVAVVDSGAGGPLLRSARSFSILAGTGGVVNTLATTVSGDLGVSPSSSVMGFPPGEVAGTIHAGDAAAAQAQVDRSKAYDDAAARVPTGTVSGDLNGATITPGVYRSSAALAITGTVTLDGGEDPNSLFVFQVDGALNTAAASRVNLINGAVAAHVFWQVDAAVGTGANSSFSGTVLAAGAITIGANAEFIGRALSPGAVTMADDTVRFTAAAPPAIAIDGGASAVTKDTTPTITGSTDAAAGTAVTVTVDDQTLATTVESDGSWRVTSAALDAGSHNVAASVRDPSGNAAQATQQLFVEVNPDPVVLGPVAAFSVLGGTGVTNTGASTVAGDLGVSPSNAVVGFPPGTVTGSIHAGDVAAAAAQTDLSRAYADVAGRRASTEFSGDLNGRTFHAGIYHTSAALALTGTVTLDGEDNPDAVFIFQVGAAATTGAGSRVVLVNGAQAANVFWQVSGAAGTGALSSFSGTIMATGAITLGAGATLTGRALSEATVTMADNTVRFS